MTTKKEVSEFLSQKTLAVVGVSRSRDKFSNGVYRELKAKGYRVFPVNPNAEMVEGDACYPNLGALPEPVGGAVVIVPRGRENDWSMARVLSGRVLRLLAWKTWM